MKVVIIDRWTPDCYRQDGVSDINHIYSGDKLVSVIYTVDFVKRSDEEDVLKEVIKEVPEEKELSQTKVNQIKHSHYKKDVSRLKMIDVYRVLSLFEVTDPCIQHAVKKLLCAGKRGGKSKEQDIREAVDSLNRALQMIAEDSNNHE